MNMSSSSSSSPSSSMDASSCSLSLSQSMKRPRKSSEPHRFIPLGVQSSIDIKMEGGGGDRGDSIDGCIPSTSSSLSSLVTPSTCTTSTIPSSSSSFHLSTLPLTPTALNIPLDRVSTISSTASSSLPIVSTSSTTPSTSTSSSSLDPGAFLTLAQSLAMQSMIEQSSIQSGIAMKAAAAAALLGLSNPQCNPSTHPLSTLSSLSSLSSLNRGGLDLLSLLNQSNDSHRMALLLQESLARAQSISSSIVSNEGSIECDGGGLRRSATMSLKRSACTPIDIPRKMSMPVSAREYSREFISLARAEIEDRMAFIIQDELLNSKEEKTTSSSSQLDLLSSLASENEKPSEMDMDMDIVVGDRSAFRKVTTLSTVSRITRDTNTLLSISPIDGGDSISPCHSSPPSPLNESILCTLQSILESKQRSIPFMNDIDTITTHEEAIKRFPVQWTGSLQMRAFSIQTFWLQLEGEEIIKKVFPRITEDHIKIVGKRRLDNEYLHELSSTIPINHCGCMIVVPGGTSKAEVSSNGDKFATNFVKYFNNKSIIGIAELPTQDDTYLLYLIAPGVFTERYLRAKYSDFADLLNARFNDKFLLVLISRETP